MALFQLYSLRVITKHEGGRGGRLINEFCLMGTFPGTGWSLREVFPEQQWATTNSDWTRKDSRWELPTRDV